MFTIDTRTIPENGSLTIEGRLDEDICQLPADDPARPAGPLTYKAEASLVSDSLLLRGHFSMPFELRCVRCLTPFEFPLCLVDHALLVPVETSHLIDLTDALREDIILTLPGFPRCDEAAPGATEAARVCPAVGSFEAENTFAPLDPEQDEADGSDTWGALDNLKLD